MLNDREILAAIRDLDPTPQRSLPSMAEHDEVDLPSHQDWADVVDEADIRATSYKQCAESYRAEVMSLRRRVRDLTDDRDALGRVLIVAALVVALSVTVMVARG